MVFWIQRSRSVIAIDVGEGRVNCKIKLHIRPWCFDGIRDYGYTNSCASRVHFRGGCFCSARLGLGVASDFLGYLKKKKKKEHRKSGKDAFYRSGPEKPTISLSWGKKNVL